MQLELTVPIYVLIFNVNKLLYCIFLYLNAIIHKIPTARSDTMSTIEQTLIRLQKSPFRAKFHLSDKDKKYINEKGLDTIRNHAADFVAKRLAPAFPINDGKQTPMRGHPVFIAQHACACCCRGCLNKWYRVPLGVELTENQQERIVNLLMAWIEKELNP